MVVLPVLPVVLVVVLETRMPPLPEDVGVLLDLVGFVVVLLLPLVFLLLEPVSSTLFVTVVSATVASLSMGSEVATVLPVGSTPLSVVLSPPMSVVLLLSLLLRQYIYLRALIQEFPYIL